MILDFGRQETPAAFKARICVVGSGPVGLSFVEEFLNTPSIDILLVESGGLTRDSAHESLNQVTNSGDSVSGAGGSRARVFGGTSTLWGGQSIPLSAIDFAHRDWVANSGWPIKFDALRSYYRRASRILRIDDLEFDHNIWAKNTIFKDEFDASKVTLTFSKWSPAPNFGKRYSRSLRHSPSVTVLVNANAMELQLDEHEERVDSICVRSISGKYGEVHADVFVLCCGGIENARILLCSNRVCAAGLGNRHGNVGKFFQDHAGYYVGRLEPLNFRKFVDLFSSYFNKSQMYLPKLQLSDDQQINSRALNVIGNVGVEYTQESTIALKRLFNDLKSHDIGWEIPRNTLRVMRNPIDSFRLLFAYSISRRMYYPRHAKYFLIANCETEPVPESRVTLSPERDILGMPKARVHWTYTPAIKHTLRVYAEHIRDQLLKLCIAEMVIEPSLYGADDAWKKGVYSMYHHIGTTRMHDNPGLGVVDAECKVHGIRNLYVGGSSVFPTSGSTNPTFTAIALAIRLADHIKGKLGSYRAADESGQPDEGARAVRLARNARDARHSAIDDRRLGEGQDG